MSLLEDFRDKNKNYTPPDYPAVSARLIAWIKLEFKPEDIHANDPLLSQKLILQHGISKVIRKLEQVHNYQEKGLQDAFIKD